MKLEVRKLYILMVGTPKSNVGEQCKSPKLKFGKNETLIIGNKTPNTERECLRYKF